VGASLATSRSANIDKPYIGKPRPKAVPHYLGRVQIPQLFLAAGEKITTLLYAL